MIDHISLSVADLDRSKTFYDRVLTPLGARRVMDVEDAPGYSAAGYGMGGGEPAFWVGVGVGEDSKFVPTPPQGQHVAFAAPNRQAVDAFHAAGLAAGGRDNGMPGLRIQYHPNYYAAFLTDPDGHRIEAVCHKPE
jgi:catechol 2,3-dioxygenase-like lactoylglutathione lyase family enzyme